MRGLVVHCMNDRVSKLIAISPQSHGALRWRKPSNFLFTRSDHLMLIGLDEVCKAAMGMPAGFIKLEEKFVLMGILGLRNNENLVVDDSGRWLAAHIPHALLGYPFRMARLEANRFQICIEEGSELVRKADDLPAEAPGWQPFFDEADEPATGLAEKMSHMQNHALQLAAAEVATAKLAELDLLKEWQIVTGDKDSPTRVRGLYATDEQRLAELPGDSLAELRDAGALMLAHAQLLSAFHMPSLIRIANLRWKQAGEAKQERELDFGEATDPGNISFDNL